MSTETILLLSKRTLLTITIIIREYKELLTKKKGVLLLPSGYEIARLAPNFTPFVFLDEHARKNFANLHDHYWRVY